MESESAKNSLINNLHSTKESVNTSLDLENYEIDSESGIKEKIPEYLTKPTIIMCNPNALVY
jgi:hypothetical protein